MFSSILFSQFFFNKSMKGLFIGRYDTQESDGVIKKVALSHGDLEQNVQQIINKKLFFEIFNLKP